MIINEDRFKKTGKRFFIIKQTPVFIILLIIDKNKEINSLSHPLISVSELIKRAIKTSRGRPRGEKLYKR
jgi:hypothetical protein